MESNMVTIISATIQEYKGERFYLCGNYFQHKGKRLHRAVWSDANGPIQKGYDVHHVNGNTKDNRIENLILLPRTEHHAHHGKINIVKRPNHINEIRPLASEWHGSSDGIAWHSERGKLNWENGFPEREQVCTWCGKHFFSRHAYKEGQNRFCCSNCCAAHGRMTRRESEKR